MPMHGGPDSPVVHSGAPESVGRNASELSSLNVVSIAHVCGDDEAE